MRACVKSLSRSCRAFALRALSAQCRRLWEDDLPVSAQCSTTAQRLERDSVSLVFLLSCDHSFNHSSLFFAVRKIYPLRTLKISQLSADRVCLLSAAGRASPSPVLRLLFPAVTLTCPGRATASPLRSHPEEAPVRSGFFVKGLSTFSDSPWICPTGGSLSCLVLRWNLSDFPKPFRYSFEQRLEVGRCRRCEVYIP